MWASRSVREPLTASYTYDSQGALTSVVYPQCATWTICGSRTSFTYTLDAMERPTGMTDQNSHIWASGATYNAANEPLYDGTATRTYNSLLQMTSIAGVGHEHDVQLLVQPEQRADRVERGRDHRGNHHLSVRRPEAAARRRRARTGGRRTPTMGTVT